MGDSQLDNSLFSEAQAADAFEPSAAPELPEETLERESLEAQSPLSQGMPFGPYLLFNRLSAGGMAEVYLAKAFGFEDIKSTVAIKRILPTCAHDPEFIRMFVDEAKLSVQLSHANIAQTLELGRIGPTFFISMEYVSGVDLRQVWDRMMKGHEFPLAAVLFVIMQVCQGLDYAHRKTDAHYNLLGIVHRDVSPQNVMVSFDGQVKIIDFGIAKARMRASNTKNGILKGKFAYMSPEQVCGLETDARTDIFATGIILYEFLTHHRLFKSYSDFSTLERVRCCEFYPPRLLNPKIALELEKMVLSVLTREPDRRISSADILHDQLFKFAWTHGETCSQRDLSGLLSTMFKSRLEREFRRLGALADIHTMPESSPDQINLVAPYSLYRDSVASSLSSQETQIFESSFALGQSNSHSNSYSLSFSARSNLSGPFLDEQSPAYHLESSAPSELLGDNLFLNSSENDLALLEQEETKVLRALPPPDISTSYAALYGDHPEPGEEREDTNPLIPPCPDPLTPGLDEQSALSSDRGDLHRAESLVTQVKGWFSE